jgi:murein DD-endopeptidase MepM/ murein hydrolase activator NlpD
MDDVIVRSRYPRQNTYSRKRKRSARKNNTILENVMRQTLLALLLLILTIGVTKLNTPLTNFITDNIKVVLTQNIDISGLYKEFDNLATQIRNNQTGGANSTTNQTGSTNKTETGSSPNEGAIPVNSTAQDSVAGKTDSSAVSGTSKSDAVDTKSETTVNRSSDNSSTGQSNTSNVKKISGGSSAASGSKDESIISYIKKNYEFIVPTAGKLGSSFGERIHPVTKVLQVHNGVDIEANQGDTVKAALGGTVILATSDPLSGNYIKLQHTNGITTLYCHCSKLLVQSGQKVRQGDKIALVGATGDATGPHLHFEVRKDNIAYDPENFIKIPHK